MMNKKEKMANIIISIKTVHGKTFSINAKTSDTILTIKQEIEHSFGHEIDRQILIFVGEKLEDHKKISDYDIRNSTQIFLALKQTF